MHPQLGLQLREMPVDGIGGVWHADIHVVEIGEQMRQIALEAQVCRPQRLVCVVTLVSLRCTVLADTPCALPISE